MNSTLPLVTKSACEFASFYKSAFMGEMLMFIVSSYLVHYWFHCHLHHGPCVLLARLQLWKVRITWVCQK